MPRFVLRRQRLIDTAKGPRLLGRARNGQLLPETPEEHVRQAVLQSLHEDYGYPRLTLSAEVLVARGTEDRRRADVIVTMPREHVRADFQLSTEQAESPDRLYSEKLAKLRKEAGEEPGLSLVELPDHVNVDVDGEFLQCQVLGFASLPNGHGLALRPPPGVSGLPAVLGILVNGYTPLGKERQLAQRLGTLPLAWNHEDTLYFIDGLIPRDTDSPEIRLGCEATALSADGDRGAMVMYAFDDDTFGVLAWVDLKAAERDQAMDQDSAPSADEETASFAEGTVIADLEHLIVVECKAPSVPLTRAVEIQGEGYANMVDAGFVVLTNGRGFSCYQRTSDGLVAISDIPTYQEVLADKRVAVRTLPPDEALPNLPDLRGRPDAVRFHVRSRGLVGTSEQEPQWAAVLWLQDALVEHPAVRLPADLLGVHFLEDLGLNAHEPGSHTAGWFGLYRDYLVQWRGESVVLGLSVLSGCNCPDKRYLHGYYRSVGYSYLVAAISDDSVYESVLQLPLDQALAEDGDQWALLHNGALTAGRGSVKRDRLRRAVARSSAHLVRGKEIYLGAIPAGGVPLQREQAADILGRIALYALVRRDLKTTVKQERRGEKKTKER